MTGAIDIEEFDRRQRPTVEGSAKSWAAFNAPIHAPSLAHKSIPQREWAVEGLVPLRAVTLFSGDGGTGKSTLALQLACSTVLQRRWLGRDTRPGKVAYLSCEDDEAEMHRRLAAIASAEDWDLADLDGLELFDRVGRDNAVMMKEGGFGSVWEPTPFWVGFSNWLTDFGPGLLVMDSLYDFFPGNQLDQASARSFMGRLRELAHDIGCAIIVLWHPSKSGMESGDGTSGNVAFRNASRAMLYLEREKDAGPDAPLILKGKKANYGPAADELRIHWQDGRFVPVVPEGSTDGVFAGIARRTAERAFLDCLAALTKRCQRVNASINTGPYAPRVMAGMKQAAGFKVDDLARAMNALLDAETIRLIEEGPPSKRRTHLAAVEPQAAHSEDDEP